MTPPPLHPTPQTLPMRPRSQIGRLFLITLVAGAILIAASAVALAASFLAGGEVRSLRQAAMAASPGTWERRIEFGVGRLPTLVVQGLARLIPVSVDPRARAAIDAVHSADVGIYERRPEAPAQDVEATLREIRGTMERRGWEPAVLVRDGGELVAVFVPSQAPPTETRVSAAVLVLSGSEMVLVSARADVQPLLDEVLNPMLRDHLQLASLPR